MKKILLILFIPLIFSSCYVHKISHGNGQVKWDGKSDYGIMMSSGLYFYRLSSSDYEETKKIVLLR